MKGSIFIWVIMLAAAFFIVAIAGERLIGIAELVAQLTATLAAQLQATIAAVAGSVA